MSELCSSKCNFSSLIVSDLILLCSFILSHTLYFSYLIFFSPYLLKLLSFLSPLFITTSLLSLAFLFHTQSHFTLQFNKDHHSNDQHPQNSDELGIYEIVFGPPSMREEAPPQIFDQTPQKDPIFEPNPLPGPAEEAPITVAGKIENSGEFVKASKTPVMDQEKRLENFLKILDNFERLASNVEEKKIKPKQNPSVLINGSKTGKCNKNTDQSISQRIISGGGGGGDSFSSYGSMRREREWKRTLAGKLFEERHNSSGGGGGGEGMDSLWEAYEMEADKASTRKGGREKEEEEDDEIGGGEVCCLQALKMSAGKMSLGVGRPKLVKISKAIKGIGWLHSFTKNSKKVHNNGDHRY
ncbi:hypothetical protein SASPL_115782 [Salvia splendens]|uniref:Uncharacterized protein n=1 Tax=Salvia splendens TaxID=180675 RepID=A0A8X9A1L8_SALSN|nr:uncharacterized protein LOC121804289 [Salvia splendens]KAG6425352.1 hypothetical protein SASPL_115782 [Salvia splendens]